MTTDKKVEEPIDLKVNEELDGSATVDLPENMVAEDTQNEPEVKVQNEDDGQEDPNETRVQRNRRKQKRDLAKAVSTEKEISYQLIKRENELMAERLANLEKRAYTNELARLEKALEDETVRLNYYETKMEEAITAGDGETFKKAQSMWHSSKSKVEQLSNVHQTSTAPVPQVQKVDPRLQKHASDWIARNNWYDPNLSNTESRIAKALDEELVSEGWDAKTREYWDELDKRLSKHIDSSYNEHTDVRTVSKGPRSVVTSSGRESVNGNSNRATMTLLPEQVRAIKEAGMWDDPIKRAKIIKRYASQARSNQY